MIVVRLIVYNMPEDKMEGQLGRSMPDGIREFPSGTIRLITLTPRRWIRSIIRAYREHR